MQDVQKLDTGKRVVYLFNPCTSHYEKAAYQPEKSSTNCLPYELKREPQAGQTKCNSTTCLTLQDCKKTNGSRSMLTGLENSNYNDWFIGGHWLSSPMKTIKSLLLIHFANDSSRMEIIVYPGFYQDNVKERLRFADMAIPRHMAAILNQEPPQL